MRELQLIRLRKMLRYAERVPWWGERLRQADLSSRTMTALADIERLPPTSKFSFPAELSRGVLLARRLNPERIAMRRTSGTTGAPFSWGMDKNELLVETNAYFFRALRWFAPSIRRVRRAPLMATFIFGAYGVPQIQFHWNPAGEHAEADFQRIVDVIREKKLKVFFTYPTNILLFAKKVAETGQTLPLELVVTVGQKLDDESRDLVERYLGCPVFCVYGAREFGLNAAECPLRKHWYHINSERLYVEITDEKTGARLPEGQEGRITMTSLDNRAMPLFRYQLDDRGKLLKGPCPCGRTLPLLEVRGKDMHFIRLQGGKLIPFRHINIAIHFNFFDEIEYYQIIQSSLDGLIVRLKLRGVSRREFERRFLPALQVHIGNTLRVKFEYPAIWEQGTSNKLSVFVPLSP